MTNLRYADTQTAAARSKIDTWRAGLIPTLMADFQASGASVNKVADTKRELDLHLASYGNLDYERLSAQEIIDQQFEVIGWFVALIAFLVLCYYVCIVGWDLIYIILSFFKGWGANPSTFLTVTLLHSKNNLSGLSNCAINPITFVKSSVRNIPSIVVSIA